MAQGPEGARLATLRSYDILDTGPELAYDELVRRAAEIFGAPMAALTLVDVDRCWFKARVGIDSRQMTRDSSFCGYAFASKGMFVVPDALSDERFRRIPLVTGPAAVRFYVGAPLRAPDENAIGTLCVLDQRPICPTHEQLVRLGELADAAMRLLEKRRDDAAQNNPVAPVSIAPRHVDDVTLVVEDQESVRAFATEALKHLGHVAFSANDGAEAMVRIAELRGRVRLVVTDLQMPVMGGLELVRALRRMPNPPAVVVMSGNFTDDNRQQLLAENVRCLLGKPFSMDELKLAVLHAQTASR
jgi:CheY-like chemotaxis protein